MLEPEQKGPKIFQTARKNNSVTSQKSLIFTKKKKKTDIVPKKLTATSCHRHFTRAASYFTHETA
jgi:hypothetical protein